MLIIGGVAMLDTYKRFWMLINDYDSKDTRYQFWFSMVINIILLGFIFYFFLLSERIEYNIFIFIIIVYLILMWAMLSSVIRRINDVGKDNIIMMWAIRVAKIFIAIGCLLLAMKYFLHFDIIPGGTSTIFNGFYPLVIIFVLLYALLPSNYFSSRQQKNSKI